MRTPTITFVLAAKRYVALRKRVIEYGENPQSMNNASLVLMSAWGQYLGYYNRDAD